MKALREKHLACVADNLSYFNDCKTSFAISECKSWINKIFDDVEAELEEAMKPKSCSLCESFTFDEEFNDGFGQCFYGIHFPNSYSSSCHKGDCNYCSEFKPKDNA